MRSESTLVLPAPLRIAHARSIAGLDKIDRAARVKLAGSGRTIVRATRLGMGTPQALVVASDALEAQWAADIALVRSAARGESSSTLDDELRALDELDDDIDLDDGGDDLDDVDVDYIDEDEAASVATGKGLSAAWLAAALLLLSRRGQGADPADIGDQALQDIAYRVDGAATTEASLAFNREREASFKTLRRRGLYKRWDAVLDRVVCDRCRRLDGTTVPMRHPYPGNLVPGYVHPRCRCLSTLIPAYLVGDA